ncbi:hypothetical protein [Azospira sp.]|uniref:hypothetical protein n=1 Tax=Azospira sp. TaxID=1872671 RepID=UPI00255E768A|nr:hypothetical protein [Azospira sp.]MDK9690020.1 hypothetical protein [Azospira sp.]
MWNVKVLFLLFVTSMAQAAQYSLNWYHWLNDYPWPARYIIVVSGRYESVLYVAQKANKRADTEKSPEFRKYEELFTPTYPLKDTHFSNQNLMGYSDYYEEYGQLGFQVIEFDKTAQVLTSNSSLSPLKARQTRDGDKNRVAMLVAGEGLPGDYWYWLGDWFDGFPSGDGGEFTPALCHHSWDDGRYAKNSSDAYFHPKQKFDRKKVEADIGLFGCREWTYQLYRRPPHMGLQEFPPGPPYIDVTSYGGKHGEKTRIGNFLGWAQFDDPPRPVIGKHGKYWVCLHECPDGEKPGLIPDIKEWTGKRGWPLPKPTPTFPDSKFKNPYKPENPD